MSTDRALVLGGGGLAGIAWETGVLFGLAEWMNTIAQLAKRHPDPQQLRRAIGAMALATSTVAEDARRAVVQARLPHHDWPAWQLRIVTVDAHTGDPVVFDRAAGVELVDAVTASCAVPGVWPPATINGTRYIDGGTRTMTNADLAAGYQRVLVLAALDEPVVHQQVARLERAELIQPDEASLAAFGTDPLDPSTRTPAAEAGRAQGIAEAARIAALWHS